MPTNAKTKEAKEPTKSKDLIFIEKIKFTNEKTAIIQFKKTNDECAQLTTFTGKEQTTDKFYNAFQKTIDGFIQILPTFAKDSNHLTMNAIRFDYGKADYLQRVIYSVKFEFNKNNNAVININTPYINLLKDEDEETKENCLNSENEADLHEVLECAKAYMNGETRLKQMSLIVDNTKD